MAISDHHFPKQTGAVNPTCLRCGLSPIVAISRPCQRELPLFPSSGPAPIATAAAKPLAVRPAQPTPPSTVFEFMAYFEANLDIAKEDAPKLGVITDIEEGQ